MSDKGGLVIWLRLWPVFVLALVLSSCGPASSYGPLAPAEIGSQTASVQEVSFRSQGFRLVGDLRLHSEGDLQPAIILVHDRGSATREGDVPFTPLIEIFLRNGYAVFSWDKPGSGESTGQLDKEHELTQRAAILVDALGVLAGHTAIDSSRIGLWGIGQAGWVMPLALQRTHRVAFMIVVSGGGEDSIEQEAFQAGQKILCHGGPPEQAALVEKYWARCCKAATYSEYLQATHILLSVPNVRDYTGLELVPEDRWQPLPHDSEALFNPVEVVRKTTIPVLAFFGGLDREVDPVQGAEAYRTALREANNPDYQVQVIPGAGHTLIPSVTGCPGEVAGDYDPRGISAPWRPGSSILSTNSRGCGKSDEMSGPTALPYRITVYNYIIGGVSKRSHRDNSTVGEE